MYETAANYLLDNTAVLVTAAVAAVLLLVLAGRTIRAFARAKRRAEILTGPVMFLGFIWSAEAVWELTGEKGAGLPLGPRVVMFTVLEFMLAVAMLRTSDSMKDNGHPGNSGKLAWGIAILMAVVGFLAGVVIDKNLGVAFFRPIVPLVLTSLWWIGIVGEGDPGETSSWNWTPRNLLIRVGALKPGKQDVKKVQRDHLVQRMTDLYHQIQHTEGEKRKKFQARLAKMTLDADDAMVREVMTRVGRTSWVSSEPIPYAVTQKLTSDLTQQITDAVTQQVAHQLAQHSTQVSQSDTQTLARHDAGVALPPARRAKNPAPATSRGYAGSGDAGTQAARYAITHAVSNREAAQKFSVSEGTVRNRRKELEAANAQAAGAHDPINGHPVLAHTDN